MGFKNSQQYLPERFVQNKNKYWKDVVEHSSKIVTFLDLCGHEKYLRTTIFGMVAMVPDYSAIIIGSNMGISKMTREHLGISLFLKIPFIIVLTKIDIAPETVFNDVLETLKKLIRSPIIRKTPVMIKTDKDVEQWAKVMHGDTIVPIFTVSNVTGENMDLLKKFISLVPNRDSTNKAYETKDSPFQYDIQEHFQVTGVGTVVSGLIRAGTAKIGQHVLLGPDKIKCKKLVFIILKSSKW